MCIVKALYVVPVPLDPGLAGSKRLGISGSKYDEALLCGFWAGCRKSEVKAVVIEFPL